jgi:hypothetical protein
MLIVEANWCSSPGVITRIHGYGSLRSQGRQRNVGSAVLQIQHDGQITPKSSSSKIKNISLYRNSDLQYQSTRPAPTEGRFAIVTTRWVQDAVAAAISGVTA